MSASWRAAIVACEMLDGVPVESTFRIGGSGAARMARSAQVGGDGTIAIP